MSDRSTAARKYRRPAIVHMGLVSELTKANIMGDICDGTPCTGAYRYFKSGEGPGTKSDHPHDPKFPLTKPK